MAEGGPEVFGQRVLETDRDPATSEDGRKICSLQLCRADRDLPERIRANREDTQTTTHATTHHYTNTHTRIHTDIHTDIHTRTRTRICPPAHTRTCTRDHTSTLALHLTHPRLRSRTSAHTRFHTTTRSHLSSSTHTCTRIRIRPIFLSRTVPRGHTITRACTVISVDFCVNTRCYIVVSIGISTGPALRSS